MYRELCALEECIVDRQENNRKLKAKIMEFNEAWVKS